MALLEKRKGNGGLMPSLRSNFDELFDLDRFFDDSPIRFPSWDRKTFSRVPATNIREMDDHFAIEVAAPGLTKKDFQVNLDNNLLEIKVEKEDETKEEKGKYTRREYDYRAFYRSFTLPEHVNAEKIKAEYKDGVLKVRLPKTEKTPKKPMIEISVD